ncbi:hypothetical protein TRIUR3_34855 [Triticum urartu]|uniref:Uncharacterized protein n=1 Tax=Triticum urartu TaxID=4572 RepID=M7ZZA1_TRIUA|nr:hypothetical protein TRIUR3_34855 [Triticum urartu]
MLLSVRGDRTEEEDQEGRRDEGGGRAVHVAAAVFLALSMRAAALHLLGISVWSAVLLSFQVCAENPRCGDLNNVPSLPAVSYMLLRNKFFLTTSTLTATEESRDKTTTKLLIRLQRVPTRYLRRRRMEED